jgi:hypothetical protein
MPAILLVVKHYELDVQNAQQLIRIARETATPGTSIRTARGATAGGDERKLRGLPVIGRGVAGVIAGTSPHTRP